MQTTFQKIHLYQENLKHSRFIAFEISLIHDILQTSDLIDSRTTAQRDQLTFIGSNS